MIDQRYSLESFRDAFESEQSVELSKLLEKEIQEILHPVVDAKLKEVISHLNSMGHNLALYYRSVPGDIAYRDESRGKCMLRVGADCVISTGFLDTIEFD